MSRVGGQLALGDRLRTISVTAILTSVGWLAFGGSLIQDIGGLFTLHKSANPGPADGRVASGTVKSPPLHKTPVQPPLAQEVGDYVLPVAGIRPDQLTDTFTAARGGGTRVHDAIDIMAPRGTPVVAASAGLVEKLFTSKQGGLTIYVRSPDRRTITYYAHLDAYMPGLAEQQQVAKGQQLGTVGYSGNADPAAPHLHFAIMETTPDSDWWEPSVAVNPYPILSGNVR